MQLIKDIIGTPADRRARMPAMAVTAVAVALAPAAHAGWIQTGAGPYNYLDAANWSGSSINDDFPSSLTLTANQAATFGAGHTTGALLNFDFAGNYGLMLLAAGGDQTLMLGGNVDVDTVGDFGGINDANVVIGSVAVNQGLNVNLGGANRTFSVANNRMLTLTNVVSNGAVTKTGAGFLQLSGTNTYAGGTYFNAGQIRVAGDAALGNVSGGLIFNGGRLAATSSFTTSRSMTLNAGGGTLEGHQMNGTLTFNGAITGSGALSVSVSGFGNPIVVLTQANNYTGGTVLSSGNAKLELHHAQAAGTGAISAGGSGSGNLILLDDASVTYGFNGIVKTAGVWNVDVNRLASGTNQTLTVSSLAVNTAANNDAQNYLNVTGGNGYTLAIPTVTFNVNTNKVFTFNPTTAHLSLGTVAMGPWDSVALGGAAPGNAVTGAITSEVNNASDVVGSITKTGTSTWTLSGVNTYNGRTDVTDGTLLINGSITPNANHGGVYVAGGTLGGTGVVNTFVNVASSATLAPGSSIGALTVGNTTFDTGAVFSVEVGSGVSDLLIVNGDLDLSALGDILNVTGTFDNLTSYVIATYTGHLTGTFDVITSLDGTGYSISYGTGDNSQIVLSIPEPASIVLIAVAGLLIAPQRRRR